MGKAANQGSYIPMPPLKSTKSGQSLYIYIYNLSKKKNQDDVD